MVAMKAKKSTSGALKTKGVVKRAAPSPKISIGVLVGKDFDPATGGMCWPRLVGHGGLQRFLSGVRVSPGPGGFRLFGAVRGSSLYPSGLQRP